MKRADFWNGALGIGYICVFLAILAFVAYLLFGHPEIKLNFPVPYDVGRATTTASILDTAPGILFECDSGKSLKAEFTTFSARLSLSDSRQITLPQAMSGSGARYTNTNETFVFWNKGNLASVEENGHMTYANCLTQGATSTAQ